MYIHESSEIGSTERRNQQNVIHDKALTSFRIFGSQGLRGLDGALMAELKMEASDDATRKKKKKKCKYAIARSLAL